MNAPRREGDEWNGSRFMYLQVGKIRNVKKGKRAGLLGRQQEAFPCSHGWRKFHGMTFVSLSLWLSAEAGEI